MRANALPSKCTVQNLSVFPMPIGETGNFLALLTKVSIKKRFYLGLLLKRKCAFFFPLIFGKDLLGIGDNEEEGL